MANSQYILHLTQPGDRYDLLAWKYYGDATLFGPIIAANFGRGITTPVFAAGVALAIPILMVTSSVQANDLPPWKRGS